MSRPLAGQPSAADYRTWLEDTPAGRLRQVYGADRQADPVEVRRHVDAVAEFYEVAYQRKLTEEQRRAVAVGAEFPGTLSVTDDTDSIARAMGWSVVHDNPATSGRGLAVMIDGRWQSPDPATAAQAEANWQAARARDAERGPAGPVAGVAGAS